MAIITKHKCDRCGTLFDNPIPSIKYIHVSPELSLQVTASHSHCVYDMRDMCDNCKDEILVGYVANLPKGDSHG